ncbi:TPA: hypothetical protein QDZ34_003684 [Stenotrophomonas maltophilia]|nr:hypothetical protein [Stenotrophomonas maltophilia]HDS1024872.1 hypothetical protein [Stenotrophomonas maltophilia]HDS1030498.1 hypothetical protein [Stenotrophomonas maltophilia]HDS1036291.1 hypothetical protein [Stenotrophomonas maltophilia]
MKAGQLCVVGVLLLAAGCSRTDPAAPPASAEDGTTPAVAAPAASAAPLRDTPGPGSQAPGQAAANAVGAASPALAANSAVPTTRGFLDGERGLMNDGAMSDESAGQVIASSEAYAQALQQFEHDAARNPDAQDLTALYRAAATRTLGPDMVLDSFACGYSLCMGEIHSRNDDGFGNWIKAFGEDSAAPQYAFMSGEFVQAKGGQSIGRFVFSTDPAANGINTR